MLCTASTGVPIADVTAPFFFVSNFNQRPHRYLTTDFKRKIQKIENHTKNQTDMSILAYIAASVATVGVTVPPVIVRASVNWTDADWPAELGVLSAL